MTIGYIVDSYAERRNIIGKAKEIDSKYVPFSRYLMKYSDIFNEVEKLHQIIYPEVDLLHFFNRVSYGSTPWISTFETILPRFKQALSGHHGKSPDYSYLQNNKEIHKALKALAKDSCKSLIALSKCNLEIQKYFLNYFDSELVEPIYSKLTVVPPPQKQYVQNWEEKGISIDGDITFTFVGRDFAQKGGLNILYTFIKLRKEYPINLNIISSMNISNYVVGESETDITKALKIIEDNENWIKYYPKLPNDKVIEIMKQTHIGLLPTWADTYGYSVLEFQSCGCPVITTDVRALPEINSNERGWMIDVPKNALGEGLYLAKEERTLMNETINKELENIVENIFNNKQRIIEKSALSLQNIELNHSELLFSEKLINIYNAALDRKKLSLLN